MFPPVPTASDTPAQVPSPRPAARRAWHAARRLLGGQPKPMLREAALFEVGAGLLGRRRAGAPFTVAVLDFEDLLEVPGMYGAQVSRAVVRCLMGKLEAAAGPGVVGRTGAAQFTLVLPSHARESAQRRIQRAFGSPARLEFDAGHSEIVLVPDVLLAEAGANETDFRAIQHRLAHTIARFRSEQQARHGQMQRERERHSRPHSVVASL